MTDLSWLDGVIGAGTVLIGFFYGAHREKAKKPEPYEPPKAICGCTHHYSSHDEDGCHGSFRTVVERSQPKTLRTRYEGEYSEVVYEHERFQFLPCACKRYVGPEPLPQVYAP